MNLEGGQELTKNEQKSIKGGDPTYPSGDLSQGCFSGYYYCPNPDNLPVCHKNSDQL
ncbi:hypothetical protein [Flavobacterium sp. ZB4P13]|uniref:hypothetical protein n=1 Tax=Flavobacterium sp. ZB4P13 TaxID=3401728 RepID=UPI003AAA2C0E